MKPLHHLKRVGYKKAILAACKLVKKSYIASDSLNKARIPVVSQTTIEVL